MIIRRSLIAVSLVTAFAVVLSLFGVPHDPKHAWPVPAEARKIMNPVPPSEAALAAGKKMFTDECVSCHGEAGKGDGPDAMMYDPQPADLSDAHMMGEMTDGEIFYKITEGRKPMPSFKKKFTDEQRWQLVHFVRTLAPKNHRMHAAKKPATKPASQTTKAPAKPPAP